MNGSVSQTVGYGAAATAITAIPGSGYHFVNWTEGSTVASTTATLTIANVTVAHSYTANFEADPVNGVCGSSNGSALLVAPTTNLCSVGTASSVSSSSPWSWECAGTDGGATASCSAIKQVVLVAIPGDCDNSRTVSISEVQSAIDMFLGIKSLTTCVDVDNTGGVSVSIMQKVINAF